MKIHFSRNCITCISVVILILSGNSLVAQSADQTLKSIPGNVKQNAASKASSKTNTVSNNALDKLDSASNKAFKGITNLFKKKAKNQNANSKIESSNLNPAGTAIVSNTTVNNEVVIPVVNNTANTTPVAVVNVAAYNNYDFRAGDKIIFEDEFVGDADGEFPSHWNLLEGQGVINKIDGLPSFALSSTPGMRSYSMVSPLMTKPAYLTGNFSVEFDQYLTSSNNILSVFMYDNTGNVLGIVVSGDNAHYVVTKTSSAKDVANST